MYYMKRLEKKDLSLKNSLSNGKISASVKASEPAGQKLVKSKSIVQPKKAKKVVEEIPVKKQSESKTLKIDAAVQEKSSKIRSRVVLPEEIKVKNEKKNSKAQLKTDAEVIKSKTAKTSPPEIKPSDSKALDKKSGKKGKTETPVETVPTRSKSSKKPDQTLISKSQKTSSKSKSIAKSPQSEFLPKKSGKTKIDAKNEKKQSGVSKIVSSAENPKLKDKAGRVKIPNIKSAKAIEKVEIKPTKKKTVKAEVMPIPIVKTIEQKPVKKKIKPIGSAVVRGRTSKYDFEIFPLDAEIKDGSAIYLISKRITDKRGRGHHKFVCIGQTESLLGDLKKHKKDKCIKQYNANVVCLLREEDAKNRLKIETDLREAHTVFCNQK